jgi:shikimate dehydrogenase
MSPRFQQRALDVAGINVQYLACDTPAEQLALVLRELGEVRAAGNVTIPHKEAMIALCTHLTPLAARVGAVNTFWHSERGELVGHNTDVPGVDAAIRAVIDTPGNAHLPLTRVAVLGAGGAAASTLVALYDGFRNVALHINVFSRTQARAERLLDHLRVPATVSTSAEAAVRDADLVINASPVGMQDESMPVRPERLAPHSAVLDLVYKPGETSWVRACRARGHRAEDGLRMLVEQGAESFRCWFGKEPNRRAMWSVLEPRPFV